MNNPGIKLSVSIRSSASGPEYEEAWRIINKVTDDLGKPRVAFVNGRPTYNSGYFCELPEAVGIILRGAGEKAAVAFAKAQFGQYGCEVAFRLMHVIEGNSL